MYNIDLGQRLIVSEKPEATTDTSAGGQSQIEIVTSDFFLSNENHLPNVLKTKRSISSIVTDTDIEDEPEFRCVTDDEISYHGKNRKKTCFKRMIAPLKNGGIRGSVFT